MEEIDLEKNKSFCIFPFIHISSIGNSVKPCCRFAPDSEIVKKYHNLKEQVFIGDVFTSEDYDDLRTKMLNSEMIEGCYKCYKEEENSGMSMRKGAYKNFKHLLSPDLKPGIKYLEIGFSRLCNLKCRTCSYDLSTSWFSDEKEIIGKYEDRKLFLNTVDLNTMNSFRDKDLLKLEYIKFVGGEPMLNKEFSDFLERLISLGVNKNCVLKLYTNSTYFPEYSIIKSLISFKRVRVHFSIDAYDERNEYIRCPSRWGDVDSVVSRWLKLRLKKQSILFQLETTISIYNIFYLEELLDWWIAKNKNINNDEYMTHLIFVFYPRYLSVLNIPLELKKMIVNTFRAMKKKYKENENIVFCLDNIITTMNGAGENNIDDFLKFTKELDLMRNENFENVFPELNILLKKYK